MLFAAPHRTLGRLVLTVALGTLSAAALSTPAFAHDRPAAGAAAVFVQTDNPVANAVVAYDRSPDGTLTQAGIYDTGGLGGVLTGSVVDHLASQGSLALDAPRHTL
jgi:hypothetical protein